MKKILIVVASLNGGGAEKMSLLYLQQLDADFFEKTLYVVAGGNEIAHLIQPDTSVINSDLKNKLLNRASLFRYIQRHSFDIIFTSDINLSLQLAIHKTLTRSFQLVVRLAGNPVEELNQGYFSKNQLALFAFGLRQSDYIVCQSSSLMEEAITFFHLPRQKCHALRNPIDKNGINNGAYNQSSPFNTTSKTVVAAGRLHPSKGFDVLIKAIAILVKDHNINLVLYILGSDRGAGESLEQLVHSLGLDEYVQFAGFVQNPYVYYVNCDVFVLSSRYEASPNALIENHFLNTPLVSTDCAEIVHDMINANNGIIVENVNEFTLAEGIRNVLSLNRDDIFNQPLSAGNVNRFFQDL